MRFTVLLLILFLLCAGPVYALSKDGLILYLPFNEGSGKVARDASGNGNNGELNGNSDWVEGR